MELTANRPGCRQVYFPSQTVRWKRPNPYLQKSSEIVCYSAYGNDCRRVLRTQKCILGKLGKGFSTNDFFHVSNGDSEEY
uniref:Uncharacterized protein n=1 Tax=Sphaerodactylus townsendi TaxID=933632 RepID=A0ACB8F2Q6_9SAUR